MCLNPWKEEIPSTAATGMAWGLARVLAPGEAQSHRGSCCGPKPAWASVSSQDGSRTAGRRAVGG